ncbi:site-specific integrase [Actinomadura geliboluensis]|uniref:site-specific integrase n=1 Tax=Actinomadura geliboluensis TaxID=882440 RepID=UPI00260184B7|nr:site-specific integrase [Actinomadura geliboluensis]
MQVWVGEYRASIYREGEGWTGAISLGCRPDGKRCRLKRKAPTQRALMRKLVQAAEDLADGVRGDRHYTVQTAAADLLNVLAGKGLADTTVQAYRTLIDLHLVPQLGRVPVRALSADQVEQWLSGRAETLTTSTLRILHGLLRRALRRAQRHDKVARNVAELVDTPHGRPGRRSRSLTRVQAAVLLEQALCGGHRLGPYVAVGLLTGLRTEELRALRWRQVDLDAGTVVVTRSDRFGSDTKTPGSRRGLRLADLAVRALLTARSIQAADKCAAGAAYQDSGLVFAHPDGTALTAAQVRGRFRAMTRAAGLGESWCPRELRHTFVSLLSHDGLATQKISDLIGHHSTAVTETVYRHQLQPVIEDGAERMQAIFTGQLNASA